MAETSRVDSIRERLKAAGQLHLLTFHDDLAFQDQEALLDQLHGIDFDHVQRIVAEASPADPVLPGEFAPATCFHPDDVPEDAAILRKAGDALIREGKVAAFTVAGGQGTRLGWNGPKGSFPATPITGKPLFQCFAEQLIAVSERYGCDIPWYIMTSPENDDATRSFFLDNNCFGLPRGNIFLFPQGLMPSLDAATGRMLLAERGRVAMNPNGHGGTFPALQDSGALEDMVRRGIEHISYFQVDNPLARIMDPLFVGLHVEGDGTSGNMTSKMVRKCSPEEKVGVFCRHNEQTMVLEYTDLPEDRARETDEEGRLIFGAGSMALHMIGVDFVHRLVAGEEACPLPWHCARKVVAHVDPGNGTRVMPDEPNAMKFETFVFDALPMAGGSLILEALREEEFGPIKNDSGTDSPESSRRCQVERAARWLESTGFTVPRRDDGSVDGMIEIGPLVALAASDCANLDLPTSMEPGESLALG